MTPSGAFPRIGLYWPRTYVHSSRTEPLPAAEAAELELGPPSKFASGLRPAQEIWLTATRTAPVWYIRT